MNMNERYRDNDDYKDIDRVTRSSDGAAFTLIPNKDGTYQIVAEGDLPEDLKGKDLSHLTFKELEVMELCPIVETINFNKDGSPATFDDYLKLTKNRINLARCIAVDNSDRAFLKNQFLSAEGIYRCDGQQNEFFLVVSKQDDVFELESLDRKGHIETITLDDLLSNSRIYSPVKVQEDRTVVNGVLVERKIYRNGRLYCREICNTGGIVIQETFDDTNTPRRAANDVMN